MSDRTCDVVLVESEGGVARALAAALERHGHRVLHASDAATALALPDPDVLIAVLGAPGDLDLLREGRRRGRLARTVLLDSGGTPQARGHALELGACDVLRRPVELPELVRAVESAAAARPGELRLALRTDLHVGELAARELLSFALRRGVRPAARARMAGAAAEAVENARRHAYPRGAGAIELALRIGEREASLRVRDRGQGFDPALACERALRSGRLTGIERARALAEDFELWSEPGRGTTVLLRFGIFGVQFDGAPTLDLSELDYLAPRTADELVRALSRGPTDFQVVLSPALAVSLGRLLAAAPPVPKERSSAPAP